MVHMCFSSVDELKDFDFYLMSLSNSLNFGGNSEFYKIVPLKRFYIIEPMRLSLEGFNFVDWKLAFVSAE